MMSVFVIALEGRGTDNMRWYYIIIDSWVPSMPSVVVGGATTCWSLHGPNVFNYQSMPNYGISTHWTGKQTRHRGPVQWAFVLLSERSLLDDAPYLVLSTQTLRLEQTCNGLVVQIIGSKRHRWNKPGLCRASKILGPYIVISFN